MKDTQVILEVLPKLVGNTWRKYPTTRSIQLATYGTYQCPYCDNKFEAQVNNVKVGATTSCGCYKRNIRILGNKNMATHNLYYHKFYNTWNGMMQRCNNQNNPKFPTYGARGITLCEEWLDIKNFIAWAESTYIEVDGVSLDRIDNDKGYSPENCRWVDKTTQNINQRMKKNNTSGYVGISWNTKIQLWSSKIGINGRRISLGNYVDIMEAVKIRDQYIIDNGLPHKLSKEYNKGTK